MFIIIEGIDGSGKTSVAKALQEKLGDKAITVKYPSPEVTEQLSTKPVVSAILTALLEMSDSMYSEVRKAYEEGKHIIFDRFFLSTIVYQGIRYAQVFEETSRAFETAAEMITRIMAMVTGDALNERPALNCFCLDLPAEEAKRRITERGDADAFDLDDLPVMHKRAQLYKLLTSPEFHINVVGKTPEQIADEILEKCNVGHEEAGSAV